VLSFLEWLELQEDAGPLGPGGSSIYVNDRPFVRKGAKPKRTTPDDDGMGKEEKPEKSPEKLFGMMKKKSKKT